MREKRHDNNSTNIPETRTRIIKFNHKMFYRNIFIIDESIELL